MLKQIPCFHDTHRNRSASGNLAVVGFRILVDPRGVEIRPDVAPLHGQWLHGPEVHCAEDGEGQAPKPRVDDVELPHRLGWKGQDVNPDSDFRCS